jgi:protein SCO1/2
MATRATLRIAFRFAMVAAIGIAAWLRMQSQSAARLPEYGVVPPFQLADEHGAALSRAALLDKATVIDFVFTSCSSACPLLSSEMERLQGWIRDEHLGERVRLISVSVDPQRDTPERLREYAARYHADPALWHFLRGDEGPLRSFVVDGMKQVMDRQADPSETDGFTILHGTRLVVVDGMARMRGLYDAKAPGDLERLRHDLRLLARVTRGEN